MTLITIFYSLYIISQLTKIIIIILLMNYSSTQQKAPFSTILLGSESNVNFNRPQVQPPISVGGFYGVNQFNLPPQRNILHPFHSFPIPIMKQNQQLDTLSWSQDNVLAFGYYDLIFFYKVPSWAIKSLSNKDIGLCTQRVESPINLLRFFDNEKICLGFREGPQLQLYDVVRQANIFTIFPIKGKDAITAVEKMDQNCLIYSTRNGLAAIFDVRMRREAQVWLVLGRKVNRIRHNPYNKKILTESEGGLYSIHQMTMAKQYIPSQQIFLENNQILTGLQWITKSNCFATTSKYSEQLCIFSESGQKLSKKVTDGITSMAYSRSTNSLLLSFEYNKQIRIISADNLEDLENAKELGYIRNNQHCPFSMLFDRKEEVLACASSGNLRFYDPFGQKIHYNY